MYIAKIYVCIVNVCRSAAIEHACSCVIIQFKHSIEHALTGYSDVAVHGYLSCYQINSIWEIYSSASSGMSGVYGGLYC
jgi:hypothetical protein